MPLGALLVQTARVVGTTFIHACSPFVIECRRIIEQPLFHVPVTLFCTDGELEVFARYRVPVLFVKELAESFLVGKRES
jgi:hypothetical protein